MAIFFTLSDAIREIRFYLEKQPEEYVEIKPRLDCLLHEMKALCDWLETPQPETDKET